MAEWHTSGGLNIPTVGERMTFYNVSGVPHVRIDGLYSSVGAGSCSGAAASYRGLINQRLTATSGLAPVRVEGFHSVGTTTLSMSVTCTLEDAVTLLSPRVYLIVLEDDVLFQGRVYDHIVRAEFHQDVSLPTQGSSVTVAHDFPLGAWNTNNLSCVAFLQKMTGDKEIYNSARIGHPADFEFAWEAPFVSVPQGSGTAQFRGELVNITAQSDVLTLSLDNTFDWPAEFMVEGEAGYHSTPSVITLTSQEDVQVHVRVHTDSEVRCGEGNLLIHSDLTDRTEAAVMRVFNGSPAILLVDDDPNPYPIQQTFIDALNARPYLFDMWDVSAYYGFAPALDDMRLYDIVLWMTGYESLESITAANAEEIMDFMDLGKGIIISSQDFLSYFAAGSTFLVDYLGIGSFTTNVRALQANGVAADPIGNGLALTLQYESTALNRADQVNANAIGTTIFRNETGLPIAVRADNGTARSVTLAFAGECIVANPSPNNCATLTDRAIQWIIEGQGQDVEEREVAVASRISGVCPNPLSLRSGHGEIAIQLRLSERASRAPVRVDILDLNGRLVRSVLNGTLPRGTTAAVWNGLDGGGHTVAAGIYCARLTTSEGRHSARMVVVR